MFSCPTIYLTISVTSRAFIYLFQNFILILFISKAKILNFSTVQVHLPDERGDFSFRVVKISSTILEYFATMLLHVICLEIIFNINVYVITFTLTCFVVYHM